MQNKKVIGIVVIILVAGLSFWGGMTYAGKNIKAVAVNRQGSSNQNGIGGQNGGRMMRGGGTNGGGIISGQVISIDDKSMTIGVGNGGPAGTQSGSKIVFFSPSIKVEKTVDGLVSDVTTGKQVLITGTTNSDGSINATSVQLRPALPVSTQRNIPAQ